MDVLFDENKVNKDFGKNGVIRDKKQETRNRRVMSISEQESVDCFSSWGRGAPAPRINNKCVAGATHAPGLPCILMIVKML